MSVLISNPERKKERTDANANDKEIYVAGLSKFVTKADLHRTERRISNEGWWEGEQSITQSAATQEAFGSD